MQQARQQAIEIFISTFAEVTSTMDQALNGWELPIYRYPNPITKSPLYQAMARIGNIADGEAPITEQTAQDLIFLLELFNYFSTIYHRLLWKFLEPVYLQMEFISAEEANNLLDGRLHSYANAGVLHPIDEKNKLPSVFSSCDKKQYRYARFEIKRILEQKAKLNLQQKEGDVSV